jgi:streptomycin 6-kinase
MSAGQRDAKLRANGRMIGPREFELISRCVVPRRPILTKTTMTMIPERLAAACRGVPERVAWLAHLPRSVRELEGRWSLSLGPPFDCSNMTCAWVAPAVRSDGTHVVLKVGMPHMEGTHELDGLRFWDGEPTVRLFEADAALNAMLLERCDPGTALRDLRELEQDIVMAGLLRRLWRRPSATHPFRPLAAMLLHWMEETVASAARWTDAGLVRAGLRLFEELSRVSSDHVLLATDLHAGNVLRARREPWLVIDPKPFVGDRAYDATQHLFNCKGRLSAAPTETIDRFADLLELDRERVRLWMFARAAAEPRDVWDEDSVGLAKALA